MLMTKEPKPGQIYRHRKHDPTADKWHEYRVIAIVQPGGEDTGHNYFFRPWRQYRLHGSETLHYLYTSIDQAIYANPPLGAKCVAYENTNPRECEPNGRYWLRPLDEFTDGRFTLSSSPDDELYQ